MKTYLIHILQQSAPPLLGAPVLQKPQGPSSHTVSYMPCLHFQDYFAVVVVVVVVASEKHALSARRSFNGLCWASFLLGPRSVSNERPNVAPQTRRVPPPRQKMVMNSILALQDASEPHS